MWLQAERKATEEQSNREESLKAVAELQEVVQGVRAESAAAQKSAEAARAKLMSEQSAREQAEKQAKNLMWVPSHFVDIPNMSVPALICGFPIAQKK